MGLLSFVESSLTKVGNIVGATYKATLGKIPLIESARKFVEANPEVAAGIGVGSALKGAVTTPFLKSVPATALTAATSSTKAAVLTSAGAVVTASAVATNPQKALSSVVQAPSSAVNFLSNIGGLAVEPSISKAKETITENPLISAAAGLLVGKAVLGGAGGLLVASQLASDTPSPSSMLPIASKGEGEISSSGEKPVTAPTETIQIGSKKRRKAPRKAVPTQINQRVNVLVNNRSIGLQMRKVFKQECIN